jgi:hypothetical protein
MNASRPLIIDGVLPRYDVTRIDVCVVDAPPDVVYDAARHLDFLEISSRLVDAAMWLRSAPTTVAAKLRGEEPPPPPPSMRLGDLFDHPEDTGLEGWIGLGEDPGREIVFGAVGAFWEADIPWQTIDPADFREYAEPGMAKIAASFTAIPLGEGRTLLAYEARTVGTNAEASKKFMRYWRFVNRFVGVIMRAALRTIAADAENRVTAGV